MSRKIRQLQAELRRSGFVHLTGRDKGDHQLWQHPQVLAAIVGLDGKDGDDAKIYMERNLRAMITLVEQTLAARKEGE